MRGAVLLVVGILWVGCVPHAQPSAGEEAGWVVGDLATSLEVGVAQGEVRLALHVTNTGSTPREFTFPTSQRYEFEVEGPGGAPLWRWSADRSFAQVITEARLDPGETWSMEAVWKSGARSGNLVAIARLVAMDRPVEQRREFELP
jgi:hypothetical protein